MLLYLSRPRKLGSGWRAEISVYLPDDISLYASNDFSLGLAFRGSTRRVCFGSVVITHSNDRNAIDGGICLAISTPIEPHSVGLATGRRNWADAAHFRQGSFRFDALGIVADQDQHLGDCHRRDAERRHQCRSSVGDHAVELTFVLCDFFVQHQPTTGDGPHGSFRRRARREDLAGPKRGYVAD